MVWLLALAGCGLDEVEHGSTSIAFAGESIDDGPADGGGTLPSANFPEPAQTICGRLPSGVSPILDLRSAWVIVAVPGATDLAGEPVAPGTARLRLSDRRLEDCAEPFADAVPEREDELEPPWGLGFTFAPEELTVGAHDLAALAVPRAERYDGTDARPVALGGTVELFQVTDDCVIGALLDVPALREASPMGGGFVAQVCTRTCVPDVGEDCWNHGNSVGGGT